MIRRIGTLLTIAVATVTRVDAQATRAVIPITIETSMGTIEAELDSVHAPVTVTNFLKYIDAKLYDHGRFHRAVRADNQPNDSVKIAVIQGGIDGTRQREGFPAIPLERTNATGIHHLDGTLSMARGRVAESATSDFFICVGAQPSLDFAGHRNLDGQGFAAFGRVTKGMDVVKKIQMGTVNLQALTPAVEIISVKRRG